MMVAPRSRRIRPRNSPPRTASCPPHALTPDSCPCSALTFISRPLIVSPRQTKKKKRERPVSAASASFLVSRFAPGSQSRPLLLLPLSLSSTTLYEALGSDAGQPKLVGGKGEGAPLASASTRPFRPLATLLPASPADRLSTHRATMLSNEDYIPSRSSTIRRPSLTTLIREILSTTRTALRRI